MTGRKVSPLLLSLIGVVAFFLVWEAGVRLFGVKEYLLPPPSNLSRTN